MRSVFKMAPPAVGVALAAGLAAAGTGLGRAADGPIEWQSDYEVARGMARQAGKPLFVAFR